MDREKIVETLEKKIAHAKREDCDFVYLPVWQAKQIAEYLAPEERGKEPQIVRCKDCKFKQDSSVAGRTWWCNRLEKFCGNDWFCADGERK